MRSDPRKNQALRERVRSYLSLRASQGIARSTLVFNGRELARLATWLAVRGLAWADATPAVMYRYIDHVHRRRVTRGARRGQPLSPGTRSQITASLRMFFRELVNADEILVNPVDWVHHPAPQPLCGRGVFSHEDVDRLLSSFDGSNPLGLRNRALVALLYGTGLRVGEAVGLDLTDYDPDERVLWIRQAKGYKDRQVPLGRVVVDDLEAYLVRARPPLATRTSSAALFLNALGRRWTRFGVHQMLKQTQARVGIHPRRGPHALRHAFTSHMLAGGADLRYLQQFLGHSSLATTGRYAHVEFADLRRALARAHPRERDRRP